MGNQDIQENQVITVNKSEKNPRLAGLKGHKDEERKCKEGQESSSNLISKLHPKSKKKRRKIAALREKSTQKLNYPQPRKRNMIRGKDKIILQLLTIHPHLMKMIQMTYNIRGLK